MTGPDRGELQDVVDLIAEEARKYLASVDDRPLREPGADKRADQFGGELPETGVGADATLRELIDGLDAHVASSGPRFFHFVIGGVTPAALGADWFQSTTDQNPGLWQASPLGGKLADVSVRWLHRPLRPAADVGRRADDGRDHGQLHGLALRAPVVGPAPRGRRRRRRPGRASGGAGSHERLRARQLPQGPRDAGAWAATACRRSSKTTPGGSTSTRCAARSRSWTGDRRS